MSSRAKQWLIAAVGTVITVTMLWLGLWQMRVFENKENESAEARAAQTPVALEDYVLPDGSIGDIYGKRVIATGHYLPDQQLKVVAEDASVRVLTALALADGRVLPVVRGSLPVGSTALPAPPTGQVTQIGVFLPSEAGEEARPAADEVSSVRLAALAQSWPQQLTPGFITLSAEDSASQGLGKAGTALPNGEGSVQNAGYALQWWVFAAFAAFMTVRFVRTIGQRGSLGTLSDQEEA